MSIATDLRLGARVFGRHPGLAAAAIVSLALGIGANSAIFSVLHHVVLAQLPYAEPDRLMVVWETGKDLPTRSVAPANFMDWRRETRAFESLAGFDVFSPTLVGRGEPERVRALSSSGNLFTTLGVTAQVGRALLPADEAPGAPGVAVLGDGLWQRLFGGSPAALGQTLTLDGLSYTIVGVMPASFTTPTLPNIDLWLSGDRGVPRTFPFAGDATTVRDAHMIRVIGRLAPGSTRASAQDELTSLMVKLAAMYPDTNTGLGVNIVPLHEQIVGDVRPIVLLLQGAVGILLLIACVNVAHLLLGQAASRQPEMVTRVSLGASRGRLVRQLLAETLVIAVPGGVLGLLLASWGLDALIAAAPAALPRASTVSLDSTVVLFATAVTLVTTVIFGVGPALQLSRSASALQAQTQVRIAGGRSIRRWHHVMVVAELALAQVLLVGAGLLVASLLASQRVDLGFASEGRIAATLSLAPERYLRPREQGSFEIDPEAKTRFISTVLTRLNELPRVRAAAASFTAPLSGAPNRGVRIDGMPEPGPGLEPAGDFQLVSPDFFRTLGIPLLQGRVFSDADRADVTPVLIVNRAFADRYFPGQDPIGRTVRFGRSAAHQIVGVVGDARYRSVEAAADPTFYIPLAQNNERWPFLSFTVWSDDGQVAALAPAIRQAVREADPLQAISRIQTFDEILSSALAARRFNTLLVGVFALTALLLAAVGTYGVMAYVVASRTREIGVRAALGASPHAIVRLLLGQGIRQSVTAIIVGGGIGMAASRLLESMLYGVAPRDVRTMLIVAAILAGVAIVATWLPARRATRINPIAALREQ
jgi:putative ABC transport system permease protein